MPAPAAPFAPDVTPAMLLRAWPDHAPLAALLSGAPGRWSRWSILAAPTSVLRRDLEELDPVDPLAELRRIAAHGAPRADPDAPPFAGGWIGWLSYDLGRVFEPIAQTRPGPAPDRPWPALELQRCPGAYVHDARDGSWRTVGDPRALPAPEEMLAPHDPPSADAHVSSPPASSLTPHAYQHSVARAIGLIHAGDAFQVNLAHRLTFDFQGAPRALADRLLTAQRPWYGAWLETRDASGALASALCSVSPELFLAFDARSRIVTTRPIKGTRPAGAAPAELLRSDKDGAELAMIVDLMRNDLGRVCDYGTVRVDDPRSIERHGADDDSGVIHGVATVIGRLRKGRDVADLLRATFPPGSVTGAPKVRAMQIIDELEPVRRGPYCGAVGFLSDCGDAMFNVAIRTACLTPTSPSSPVRARGVLDYSVGAGIVADSVPEAEWRETLAKAEGFRRAIAAGVGTSV